MTVGAFYAARHRERMARARSAMHRAVPGGYMFELLPTLAPAPNGAEWPTPCAAQDAKHGAPTAWELSTKHGWTKDSLRVRVVKRARPWEDTTAPLNPEWVEWLMGYPQGWTEVDA